MARGRSSVSLSSAGPPKRMSEGSARGGVGSLGACAVFAMREKRSATGAMRLGSAAGATGSAVGVVVVGAVGSASAGAVGAAAGDSACGWPGPGLKERRGRKGSSVGTSGPGAERQEEA